MPPSSFPRLLACACYTSGPTTQAAEDGTAKHEIITKIVKDGFIGFDEVIGKFSDTDIDDLHWTHEQIKAICEATGTKKLLADEFVSIIGDDFSQRTYGKADFVGERCLIDCKFGQKRDYYGQMTAYALGLMQRNDWPRIEVFEVYGTVRSVKQYSICYEEAIGIFRTVFNRVNDEQKKPEICEYCTWCGNKDVCPAVLGLVKTVAEKYPDEPVKALDTWKPSEMIDPINLSVAFQVSKVVADWAESVQFHVRKYMLEGISIPGLKLQKRKGRVEITDVLKAYELSKLPQEKFLAACSVSLTKLAENLVDIPKTKRNEAMEQLLGDCVERGAETFSIVKDSK
jgi:hypothetical protein